MSGQAQQRFSSAEYYRMAETGILRPDARVELLDGKINDMSPSGPFHGGHCELSEPFFAAAARGRWLTSLQNPLHLDDHSEPPPDIHLRKLTPDLYRKRHSKPEEVYLLIEVSDATLHADPEVKIPAYGRAGIAEVWIVNLNGRTVEVYRDPHFTGYAAKTILHVGDHASPLAFPEVSVSVAELFRFQLAVPSRSFPSVQPAPVSSIKLA